MSEDNLSDTTDEEPLRLTLKNFMRKLVSGRVAKQKANANKVWKPSASVAIDSSGVTNTRKRAASAASVAPEQAKASKRSRARKDQDPDSGMEVDEVPAVVKAKDKMKPNQPQVPKAADGVYHIQCTLVSIGSPGANSTGKSKAAVTRKYIPIVDDSDEDSSGNIPVDKPRPQKPAAKATAPKQQAKPKNAAPSEYAEEDVDSLPSQSEEDEPGSEPASQSDQGEEEFPENPLDEDVILIPSSKKSDLATDDKELDLSDVEPPSTSHHRQASSSSMGSMPPDTDYDFNDAEDNEEEAAPAPVDDNEVKVTNDEDIARPTTAPRKRQNTTAQQSKYAQENPEIRNSKVVHGTKRKEIQAAPESTWPSTNATLQGIVKAAIKHSLYEIAFKDGYCDIADDHGAAVEKRAKADTKFCTLLAPLVWVALNTWETGRFVHAKEFSQARLESMYKALLDVMQKQRSGQSAKSFNHTMHQLYTKISHLQAGPTTATSGSANNIICLPIDSN
ncbi:hypothetical protein C8R45DRAFT_1224269 [Mycena sanguinolenta]|nr:hypothetical protein C8R45DRAFT_1224269 [Mycena sanguinolenta]